MFNQMNWTKNLHPHLINIQTVMAFFNANTVKPTVEVLKLSGVQSGNRIRHARRFADSVRVDGSDSEVVGVSLKQPRHWVFTNLYGVVIALSPVFSSNLASTKQKTGKIIGAENETRSTAHFILEKRGGFPRPKTRTASLGQIITAYSKQSSCWSGYLFVVFMSVTPTCPQSIPGLVPPWWYLGASMTQ